MFVIEIQVKKSLIKYIVKYVIVIEWDLRCFNKKIEHKHFFFMVRVFAFAFVFYFFIYNLQNLLSIGKISA